MERTDAKDALLDTALEEELGRAAPPDVWPRLDEAAEPAPEHRRRIALAAALLVGAAAIVFAVFTLDADKRSDPPVPIVPQWPDRLPQDGPRTLDEAMSWLRDAQLERIEVKADRVFSEALGDYVIIDRHPFESFKLFGPADNRLVLTEDLAATRAALLRAVPDAEVAVPFEFTATLTVGSRQVYVRAADLAGERTGQPRFAIVGRETTWPIRPDAAMASILARPLADFRRRVLVARGIVLAAPDLRALPDGTERLRLIAIDAGASGDVARFTDLYSLEIGASPALHSAVFLRGLRGLAKLRSLVADGTHLTGAGIVALGQLTQLEELFLATPDISPVNPFNDTATGAGTIDDATVQHLTALQQLSELALPGAHITDTGLASLAQLPKLRQLTLPNCAGLRGIGFAAFAAHPTLAYVRVQGCAALDDAGLQAIAELQRLEHVEVSWSNTDPARTLASLHVLTGMPKLKMLLLDGRGGSPRATLPAGDWRALLAALRRTNKLEVILRGAGPDLDDSDLSALHGAGATSFTFVDCPGITDRGITRLKDAGIDAHRFVGAPW